MSDEQYMPERHEPEMEMSETPRETEMEMSPKGGDFSTGEGLVSLGGMILLGVWLIFEVITDDYGLPYLALLLAAAAVILPRINREKVEAYHSLKQLMKAVGWGLTIVGILVIVADIETGLFDDEAITIIAALIGWLGFAVAFQGARTVRD